MPSASPVDHFAPPLSAGCLVIWAPASEINNHLLIHFAQVTLLLVLSIALFECVTKIPPFLPCQVVIEYKTGKTPYARGSGIHTPSLTKSACQIRHQGCMRLMSVIYICSGPLRNPGNTGMAWNIPVWLGFHICPGHYGIKVFRTYNVQPTTSHNSHQRSSTPQL